MRHIFSKRIQIDSEKSYLLCLKLEFTSSDLAPGIELKENFNFGSNLTIGVREKIRTVRVNRLNVKYIITVRTLFFPRLARTFNSIDVSSGKNCV